jgi:hypothetical protein
MSAKVGIDDKVRTHGYGYTSALKAKAPTLEAFEAQTRAPARQGRSGCEPSVLSSSGSFHSFFDRGDGDQVEPGPLVIWQCSQCGVKQVEHLQPDSCFDCRAPRSGPACSQEERERGKA